jgi:hypothetical protein
MKTKKSTASYSGFYSMLFRLPVPLILLVQAITSILALRNTAFQDEALYLLAGREIFLSWMGKTTYLEPYGLYFSGYPSFYPVMGGVLDFLGGLEAARLFSLLCMLIVTTVLALLAWWSWKHRGLEEMLVRLGIALFSLVVSGFIVFINLDKQVLTGLSFTTTNRVSMNEAMPIQVMQHIVAMEGIFFGLGFLGLLLCGKKRLPTGLLLFGSALLVPLYHTYKGELVSLDKHLAFSMFFLAPLAGFVIASLAGLWQKRSVRLSWFTALALCLLAFPPGLQQARNLYEGWPSSTQLTTLLRPRVQLGIGHYLAEDFDVLRYYLKHETDIWQWSEHAGESRSAENVVCKAIRACKLELNLEQRVAGVNCDRTPYTDEPGFLSIDIMKSLPGVQTIL